MRFFIIFFLSFLSLSGHSQDGPKASEKVLREIEIRVSSQEKVEKILLGSEEPVKLELSSEIPVHFFQMLVNDKFIFDDGVYLSQVKELAVTKPGFSRLFEARAAFAKTIVPNTQFQLDLAQMGVELKFINLNLEVFNDPDVASAKTPKVVNQELSPAASYLVEILVVILLLLAGIIAWLIMTKKRHTKNLYLNTQQKDISI